jgi:toxoflavin biosynthesis protein ToxC
MIHHTSPISGIDCYGNRVVTAGYDNRLILWQIDPLGPPRGYAVGMHDHLVNQCRFSSDGRFIVSASSDYSARIWSCSEAGMQLQAVLTGHLDDVEMACFSSTDQLIATASRDHTIRIYDLSGACLHVLKGHSKDVLSVHWSGGDQLLVSSSDDGCVIIWDSATGKPLSTHDLGDTEADTIAIGPGDVVFSGDDRGQITATTADNKTHYPAHRSGIKRLIVNKDKTLLLSASYDRRLCLWGLGNDCLSLIREIAIPQDAWPRSLCISDDGQQIHMGSFGGTFRTYDQVKATWISLEHNRTDGLNALSHHDNKLWSVGDAGLLRSDGGDTVDLGSLCNTLLASPIGLLTAGQKGVVYLIRSTERDGYQSSPLYHHNCPINCSLLSTDIDGREVAFFGTYNGEVLRLKFDPSAAALMQVHVIRIMPNAVKGLAEFEPGKLFAVCANGDAVWFSVDGAIRHQMPAVHHKIANACVNINPGLIASVSRDMCLYLWSQDGLLKRIQSPHTHSIKCLAFHSPWIITASYDGILHFYHITHQAWSDQHCRLTCAGISCLLPSSNSNRSGASIHASSYDGHIYTHRLPHESGLLQ